MKQVFQKFLKGINRRFNIKSADDPTRLYTLKNARLQSRGDTSDVTRIQGALQLVSDTFTNVLDITFFDRNGTPVIVVLHNPSGTTYSIKEVLVNAPNTVTEIGTFTSTEPTLRNTELLVLEDTILLSPVNKQLNYIGGAWRLNDFISTTPEFTVGTSGGLFSEGSVQVLTGATSDATPANAFMFFLGTTPISPPDAGIYTLNIDGDTVNFSVSDTDDSEDVANAVKTAIDTDPTISSLWDTDTVVASGVGHAFNIISKTNGASFNGITPTITFSSGDDILSTLILGTTTGGSDGGNFLGSLVFVLQNTTYNKLYLVPTTPIFGNETVNDIKLKVEEALDNALTTDYTVTSGFMGMVDIISKDKGEEYNLNITLLSNPTGATFNIVDITGGTNIGGDLKENATYHYKARYVYFDGHKTVTSYPALFKTTFSKRTAELYFTDIPIDLDNNEVDIEIFRREEGGDWFLIDRVTPTGDTYTYTDSGKTEIALLDEQAYVWTDDFQTHEIVRDRYVRGNVSFPERKISDSDTFTVTEVTVTNITNGDDILPVNTVVDVYAQARFEDGLTSFHKNIGSLRIGDEQSTLTIQQNGNNTEAKEIAYYAKIQSTTDEVAKIPFNSVEIYNANVPSIATRTLSDALQDKPTNPHVFLGFKYLSARVSGTVITADAATMSFDIDSVVFKTYDAVWDKNGGSEGINTNDVELINTLTVSGVPAFYPYNASENTNPDYTEYIDDIFPETISINPSTTEGALGQTLTYKRKWVAPVFGFVNTRYNPFVASFNELPSCVYELAMVDGLKEAVRQNKAKLRLTNSTQNLSTTLPTTDFLNAEVDIVGILDTSETEEQLQGKTSITNSYIFSTNKNHVYLQLKSGSVFDSFDIESANNLQVRGDYDGGYVPDYTGVYQFELIGIKETDFGGTTTFTPYEESGEKKYYDYDIDYGLTSTVGLDTQLEGAIFLGTEPDINGNTADTPANLGFTVEKTNKFLFYKLKPSNIYEQIVTEDDLQTLQSVYPNQVIWSESYIRGSNASGIRNFTFSNFLNIDRTYGKIVGLVSVLNDLLVLCERGVAKVNVGEVVTQQVSGQVVVDSSTLLNGYFFALRNLVDLKPKSVVKYENAVFFGDGIDVWMYDGQFKNISQGAVVLNKTAEWVGAFDTLHKEYVITDGTNTYAYSLELNEWFGEYDFATVASTVYQDRMFTVLNNKLCENNVGNTMNGTAYTTIIESVANNLGDSSIVKQFRKFYVEADNASTATFKYGKVADSYQSKLFSAVENKNGMYNFGIKPQESNAVRQYWQIETQQSGFTLRMLGYFFGIRDRR